MINLIYSIIPALFFMAGIFTGFYMGKEKEVPTPRRIYRKNKKEKRLMEQEEQELKEIQELQEYMKAIDEFGE